MHPLDPPPAVLGDPKATELIRVWGAHGSQHITLHPRMYGDPATWGIILADLAQHVANAYEQLEERDRNEVLAEIQKGLLAEINHPTDRSEGRVG